MTKERVIVESPVEQVVIMWDGTRFALRRFHKVSSDVTVIILNPKEMMEVLQFAGTLGEGNDNYQKPRT